MSAVNAAIVARVVESLRPAVNVAKTLSAGITKHQIDTLVRVPLGRAQLKTHLSLLRQLQEPFAATANELQHLIDSIEQALRKHLGPH